MNLDNNLSDDIIKQDNITFKDTGNFSEKPIIENNIQKKKKRKGLPIFLVILCVIVVAILVYFLFFFTKTIMYNCSSSIGNDFFSLEKKGNNCKYYSILDCNCSYIYDDSESGLMTLYDKKIDATILYDYENKKIINKFEDKQIDFVFNNSSLYGYIVKNDGSPYSLSFYNLNKQKTTYILDQESDFKSGGKMNQKEESKISNNLIIAYKSVLDNKEKYEEKELFLESFYSDYYYGIVDLETGNIVVPFENVSLERTEFGNFLATRIGGYKVYYDEYGKVIIRSCDEDEEFKKHYGNFVEVIEMSNDLFLVDLDYSYFDIIDNNGNSLLKEKISRNTINNDLLNVMDNQEDIEDFNHPKHDFTIKIYKYDDVKYNIVCSYLSNKNRYYNIYYEFDLNTGTVKKGEVGSNTSPR